MSARVSTNALIADRPEQTKAGPAPKGTGARVIAITSGKGGVGKTNITANLGISLAAQGKKVCIFDADTSLANINILLGLTPTYTLEHLLSGEKKIEEILLQGPGGLEIIPAASGIMEFVSLNKAKQKRLLTAINRLSRRFDYLLIDTAAGINEPLLSFLQAAPYTIMTITPEPTSLTDAFSLLKVLKKRDFRHPVFVIVNMTPSLNTAHDAYKRFRDAVAKYLQLKVFYLGYVLTDAELSHAVLKQKPVIMQRPFGLASRCIKSLTDRLERTLNNHRDEEADFISLLDELLPSPEEGPAPEPMEQAETQATSPDDWRYHLDQLKNHLLDKQTSADEAEKLLHEITDSWTARFGQQPDSLIATSTAESGEQIPATVTPFDTPREAPTPHKPETESEVAGLRDALHYAQLLARNEET